LSVTFENYPTTSDCCIVYTPAAIAITMNRNEKKGRLHIAVIKEKTKTAP
jgi:hypothetical protein